MSNLNNPRRGVGLLDQFGNQIADTIGWSIVTTDIDHYIIHIGKSWVASDTITVAAASTYSFLIRNGAAGEVHLKDFMFTSTQADADIILYATPTITLVGTPITWINKNWVFQSATPQTEIFHTPTIILNGTQLEHFLISGSKQTGGSIQGGGDEWAIPANGVALLRYTNNSAQDDKISYSIKMLDVGTM